MKKLSDKRYQLIVHWAYINSEDTGVGQAKPVK